MSDEATEEKKGKKKKEKKPKKEKPPKPKKEKPPKPKKEKKPKKGKETPEGAEGGEGGKKKKGPPLLLILIPVFVVVIAAALVVIFVVLPKLRKPPAEETAPDDPDAALSAQVENTERAKKGDKQDKDAANEEATDDSGKKGKQDAEAPPDAEIDPDADAEVPPPEEEQKPADVDIVVSMTTSESISYFRSLPPEALGLPGESMKDYDIFASEHLILVDGVPCKKFHVYSFAGKAGTNSVEGSYLLTQRGARKIYKLDEATNTITELNWKPPRPEPEPAPEDGGEVTDEIGTETEPT